jgi:hypothetical protein
VTAIPAAPAAPVRVAAHRSVCGAPRCHRPIERGQLITKQPGTAWRHLDCADPHRDRAPKDPRLGKTMGRLKRVARACVKGANAPAVIRARGTRGPKGC